LELLTIITRTLQIFSSFVLIVIIFSFVSIKIKSRRNKKGMFNFSNSREGKIIMSERNSTIIDHKSDVHLDNKTLSSNSRDSKRFERSKRMKIYAVYNPDSNPNFYLYNRLNWYKNFD